jgi:hypothetical protein
VAHARHVVEIIEQAAQAARTGQAQPIASRVADAPAALGGAA